MMAKTSAERSQPYRRQKKIIRLPKKSPKTPTQRVREYRARQQSLHLTNISEDIVIINKDCPPVDAAELLPLGADLHLNPPACSSEAVTFNDEEYGNTSLKPAMLLSVEDDEEQTDSYYPFDSLSVELIEGDAVGEKIKLEKSNAVEEVHTEANTNTVTLRCDSFSDKIYNARQSKPSEIIIPDKCVSAEDDIPSRKKQKVSNTNCFQKTFHAKMRDAVSDDDNEDCDTPLASLIGHPIDNALKRKVIADMVGQNDITLIGGIQKMPKKEAGLPNKASWTTKTMEAIMKASSKYNIPFSTIKDKGNAGHRYGPTMGKKCIFTKEQESEIKKYAIHLAQMYHSLTHSDFRKLCLNMLKEMPLRIIS